MKPIPTDSPGSVWTNRLYRSAVFVVAALAYWSISSLPVPANLQPQALKAVGIFTVCILFYVTNVIPLMITSLLAVILFPLAGVLDSQTTFALFGNPVVFFILGAFILASPFVRSGLSRRIALAVLQRFGTSPRRLLLGVLVFPAFLSCWMSEHAVAAMIFPIVLEIGDCLKLTPQTSRFGKALFLAMAYGCIIGGITTFLGGGRAPLAVGILKETTGLTVDFLPWALAALPTMLLLLVAAYSVLVVFYPPEVESVEEVQELLAQRRQQLGPLKRRELTVGLLVLGTILCWMSVGRDFGLANIAIIAVVLAFVFKLTEWREVEEDVNWGIFLMYGGAICLGYAMEKTGGAAWLAHHTFGSFVHSPVMLMAAISLFSILLTEVISNSAVVALFMPVALSMGRDLGIDPRVMTMVVAIPSGLAFMLPMGTPATAIAFSSGFLRVSDTVRTGLMLNFVGWIVFNLFIHFLWPILGFQVP
ncbi:MAG: DASS family sodium-coupled anion symporter [candidate division KSB1 bacterium]|nr:DASS family sodium-coupled anion symporter [candidate division KSB1 bacterium]MDZ7275202.1 DASS family sodium-coupled anion symporter [candidate division KSB1 bacterium]MDZ7287371.1 DASS family sodium-coupled anion symporter [candidate division KSB1 bacterium]MDZ7299485.1 DASS family sodium-coupled anion symporter [candidate division KSB1 bacterium]MDZ7305469.1 DASS family sodium-coupled anion symporter [candidate division KSB1 bacterium]